MSPSLKLASVVTTIVWSLQIAGAQELSPRAYVITPLRSNAVVVTYTFFDSSVQFDGALPITGATGKYSVPVFTCYRAFNLLVRSANANASLPYAVGTFEGMLAGQPQQLYRSDLGDSAFRCRSTLRVHRPSLCNSL